MSASTHAYNTAYYTHLEELLSSAKTEAVLFKTIVNAPFEDKSKTALLGLGIIVLLLVNKKARMIDRVALSDTEMAKGAVNISAKPFKAIKIPLDNAENIIAQAINSGLFTSTADWQYLFVPDLTPEQARFNQAGAGIACSVVYPLIGARDGGALIFSYYEVPEKIGPEHHAFMQSYSTLVAKILD